MILKKYFNDLNIYNFITRAHDTYDEIIDIVLKTDFSKISLKNIPKELKDIIFIGHIKKNNLSKFDLINAIILDLKRSRFRSNNITIVDYLDYYVNYFYPPHTDIEWRVFKNNGYQIWFLKENKDLNNYGNMFILNNNYLNKKYEKMPYSLSVYKNNVFVLKNNYDHNFKKTLRLIFGLKKSFHKKDILEIMSLEFYLKNTHIYYLDLKENEYVAFYKNICHMSDVRGLRRHAINFRVLNGKERIRKNNEGFLKNKSFIYIN